MFLWFIHVLLCISFITQLYEYGTICWSILLLIDIWAVFIPWVLWIKLPQIFLYKSFYWHKFSFLFVKYLRVELLAHSGEGNGTHSSTLAWKIPWMEEPGRLQSMGSLRVRHDWATSLSLFTFMQWRRKWQPTPVFLPGESQGWRSLVDCRLWGRTESDTTEAT